MLEFNAESNSPNQVDGVTVSVGEETEPILLNIAPPEGDSLIRGFSKNLLLTDVMDTVCEVFRLSQSSVTIQRLVVKGEPLSHCFMCCWYF